MHMHHHNTGGIAIDSYACNSRLRHISAGFKAGFSMLLLLCGRRVFIAIQ